ncbi:hypothetical protein HanXRQr2_Chr04g0173141 [Helianthus annuus]|uniref:Uncharacterized protein n=1 Tax=Helianthus annuus TaxID=4232 RepID=A0A9K3J9F8_HELAN|nr:hypothetical protein HanXRQr2_Chr04g0173141 [Helianthus annuus]KAJ0931857.1 hypothetical protein HanPSC8_Chr04g0166821 [Helianthus annuus]
MRISGAIANRGSFWQFKDILSIPPSQWHRILKKKKSSPSSELWLGLHHS